MTDESAKGEGVLFLEKHFDPTVLASIRDMVKGIQEDHFNPLIDGSDSWGHLDYPTKHIPEEVQGQIKAETTEQLGNVMRAYEAAINAALDWLGKRLKIAIEEYDPRNKHKKK